MRYGKTVVAVFTVAVVLLVLSSRFAHASEYDKLMIFTFSGPVAVPGAVLPAGTYQFKLADPDTEANVVEILNQDGSHVYATQITTPVERVKATDDPVATFNEPPAAGAPETIRAIFYPGDITGMQFEYPAPDSVAAGTVAPD
jgi:hypothetical protein